MARRRTIGVGALALLGLVGLVLASRKTAVAASVVDAGGRVTESIPGVTVEADGGFPIAVPGESSESYADRIETWGLSTGQAYPTMDGWGRTGRHWYGRPLGGSYVPVQAFTP